MEKATFEPPSPATKKEKQVKRIYLKAITGAGKWSKHPKPSTSLKHLVLTTSADPSVRCNDEKLRNDTKELRRRLKNLTPLKLLIKGYITESDLRRYYPNMGINEHFTFTYFQVRTNEGNGVQHILNNTGFIPHWWLSDQWNEIHKSPNVSIRQINSENKAQISAYLSNQLISSYLSSQDCTYIRSSMSQDWIYKGWAKDYQQIKNAILLHTFKGQHRDYNGNWVPEYMTQSEHILEQLKPPPYQERLYPVHIPTDKELIIQAWNKHLEQKFRVDSIDKLPN